MTAEELQQLQLPEVRAFLEKHLDDDPALFAMKHHRLKDFPVRAIAEQIACRRKARKKLPELSKRNLIYSSLALEQASGERAAGYKSGLPEMSGKRLMDMSGGLGIDTIFFAQRFDEVVYCERDAVVAQVAEYNFRALGINNVSVIQGDSVETLETFSDDSFDLIFIDPARREKGRRSAALEAGSPDVVSLHDLLLRKADRFCVKASPALEIDGIRAKLPSLFQVIVLSVERECKEILLFCRRANDTANPFSLKAVCLNGGKESAIASEAGHQRQKSIAPAPGRYLYEPDPAIIKARLTPLTAAQFGLQFINSKVDYLTSDRIIPDFPGRSFRVVTTVFFKPGRFKTFLKEQGIESASILRRDFPLSPDEVRRRYRLGENKERFLIFSKDSSGRHLCLLCDRNVA
ncbi:MAG: hypothetical protein C1941_05960 [Prosthecochloris sp.]|nr:hypothetical protein [Prosthecochloris sp.]